MPFFKTQNKVRNIYVQPIFVDRRSILYFVMLPKDLAPKRTPFPVQGTNFIFCIQYSDCICQCHHQRDIATIFLHEESIKWLIDATWRFTLLVEGLISMSVTLLEFWCLILPFFDSFWRGRQKFRVRVATRKTLDLYFMLGSKTLDLYLMLGSPSLSNVKILVGLLKMFNWSGKSCHDKSCKDPLNSLHSHSFSRSKLCCRESWFFAAVRYLSGWMNPQPLDDYSILFHIPVTTPWDERRWNNFSLTFCLEVSGTGYRQKTCMVFCDVDLIRTKRQTGFRLRKCEHFVSGFHPPSRKKYPAISFQWEKRK